MEELEEALKKKDEDMKQMEERYKKYLEKAKSVSVCSRLAVTIATARHHEHMCPLQVIRTLDPKQNQGSGPEVQALKNQLQEKDRMLLSLEVRAGGSVQGVRSRVWTHFEDSDRVHASVCLPTEGDGQGQRSTGL